MKKTIFYNPNPILSRNSLFNFVLGARGIGKTYGFKKYCIEQAINKGRQFIYLRRYKTEIQSKKLQSFFNDLNPNDCPYKEDLKVKDNQFYYKDKLIGMALPLSTYISNKSVVLNEVYNIMFDEFIIDKGAYHYLKNEVETFLEFYFTIARFDNEGNMRNVRVFFLANAMSSTNPYFIYWNIVCKSGVFGIQKINDQILVEINKNEAYLDAIKQTNAYKIIEGTAYADYAFSSTFLRDNYNLIEPLPQKNEYIMTFIYGNDEGLGVYYSMETGNVYVTQKANLQFPKKFSLSLESHTQNLLYVKKIKSHPLIQFFLQSFNIGKMRFDTLKTKEICYNIANLFT